MVEYTSNRRKHRLNQTIFDTWTEPMAYLMGFIIADGNISNHNVISMTIHEKDIDFLRFMKQTMGASHDFKRYVKDKPQYVSLIVASKGLAESLAHFGILPNKRKTWSKFKIDIVPIEYRPSIVRGFFDGDGWICITKKTNKYAAGFANKSIEFLKQIKEWSSIKGGHLQDRKTWYQLQFGHYDSIKLRNFMYKTSGFFLKRKHKRFYSLLE